MASLMEELLDVLRTENEEYQKLIELSQQKTSALVSADVDSVKIISEQEQGIVEIIQKCDKKCDEVVSDMGVVLGRDAKTITIGELIDLLEKQPEEQNKLQAVYEDLRATALKMKACNEKNRMLVEQSLELVAFDLNLYQSMRMAPETANYSKEALNASVALGLGKFDAKQ